MIDGPKHKNKGPEGIDFISSVLALSKQCETQSDQKINSQMCQEFGTLPSLLDRASSCLWGCHGGDHTLESIVGRACSYSLAALKLARSGFYDESISLTRTLGEIANLAYLFCSDSNALGEWKKADDKKRKNEFSPFKVRLALEKHKRPIPIDQKRYSQLSEKATHLTPKIPPQMFNADRLSKAGGTYQDAGFAFCLAEMGYSLSIVGDCAVELFNLSDEASARVCQVASALDNSLAELRAQVNVTFPGTYGKS